MSFGLEAKLLGYDCSVRPHESSWGSETIGYGNSANAGVGAMQILYWMALLERSVA